MTPDNHDALLDAAMKLHRLQRPTSAETLLDHVLRKPGGPDRLSGFVGDAAGRGDTAVALLALELIANDESDQKASRLTEAWETLAQSTTRRPMAPELFDAWLRHLPRDHTEPQGNPGADVCYVLALSLPQSPSGYAMRTHYLATALGHRGLDLHCLTRPGFPKTAGADAPPGPKPVGPITYHRCGGPDHPARNDLAAFQASTAELLSRFRRIRPRVVMAASNYANALPAFMAARQLGLPFVYDVRGFWELSRVAREPLWAKSEAFANARALESRIASQADLVLTLTAPMRDELMARGVRPDRIRLLPNGADPDRFAPRPRSAKLSRRFGLPDGVPVIGYVGSFVGYEGLDVLVAACATLVRRGRDFRLLLVGDEPQGKTDLRDALIQQARDAGLRDRLILPGRVPAEEAPDVYSLIDIAPIPRKAASVTRLVSPIKPLEAMSAARAVVVSDLAALTGIVEHGRTGMVFPADDAEALARVLEALLDDPALRHELGERARHWVIAERSWATVAGLAHKALCEVMPGGAA
ncbi:glycosyltransferase family 4 protein [Sinisalibacter lacisalsi]|uniref:Glycosyltransferase WbuB n=1 Tax=Sinisalibacter lacisalsi TaxID=1526570 RepID=A0ABQ1QPT8_9RHOB|nr:glycosyltransferase family 4 protein [Sinisalibacter lacisalsi]GGD35965.1 glycosyltransferase WbuB [Sinisalibacter lacisalsi]